MHRILEILIEEFENKKPTDKYKLEQHKFCEAEKVFMDSLSGEQKKAYLGLGSIQGKLQTITFEDFSVYIFENLKKFF